MTITVLVIFYIYANLTTCRSVEFSELQHRRRGDEVGLEVATPAKGGREAEGGVGRRPHQELSVRLADARFGF